MPTNETPHYDASVNTTGCCPRFNPGGWDDQELHFRDKPFLRAVTHSVMHVPVNMGSVFARVNRRIDDAGASADGQSIVLSRDLSPWTSEHLFSVSKSVPEEEMTTLSGDFVTRECSKAPSARQGSGTKRCSRSRAIGNRNRATSISSIRPARNAPKPTGRTMSLG